MLGKLGQAQDQRFVVGQGVHLRGQWVGAQHLAVFVVPLLGVHGDSGLELFLIAINFDGTAAVLTWLVSPKNRFEVHKSSCCEAINSSFLEIKKDLDLSNKFPNN